MATLIAVLIALFTFGLNRGRSMEQINDTLTSSIPAVIAATVAEPSAIRSTAAIDHAINSGDILDSCSHVNDPGFWLFKEYFNLTIGETIKSWSVLETIISVCGLVGRRANAGGGNQRRGDTTCSDSGNGS
jgi:H+/gluconate symporter-like permease